MRTWIEQDRLGHRVDPEIHPNKGVSTKCRNGVDFSHLHPLQSRSQYLGLEMRQCLLSGVAQSHLHTIHA